jgi:PKD repeat protein
MKKINQFVFAFLLLCSCAVQMNAQCPGWNTPYPVIYITDNTPPTVDCQWVPNNGQYPFTYSWVFDDGFTTTAAHPIHIYSTAGVHSVVARITDATGCSFTRTDVIDFNNPCTADFTYTGANTVQFTPTVAGFWGQARWDFGDGSTQTNIATTAHFYQNPGTYNVCFNASFAANGCNSTACHPVVITNTTCGFFQNGANPPLITNDMIQVSLGANNTVNFAISPSSALNLALDSIKTTWDFGDGIILTTPGTSISHQYLQNGNKTVCVTAQAKISGTTTWCADSYCRTFGVNDCGFAPFTFQNFQNNPRNVFFANDNASAGCGSLPQHWDFGDGSPAIDTFTVGLPLMHVFPGTGTYTVCLGMASTNGCFNQDCQVVNIGAGQACNMVLDSFLVQNQFNGTYEIYPASISGALGDYTYNWHDGTTNISTNITGGVYALTVTDITGCTATLSDTLPACHTAFQRNTLGGGASTVVSFQNQSTPFTNYLWDFGDSTSSTERNPIHTYAQAGTYTVCLNTVNIPLYPCDPVIGQPNPCPPNECMSDQYCTTITVVQDSACIINKCVFPGDTNYDGIADMNDLLPIGAAFNMWGYARWSDSQDMLWYPHYTADWQTVFASVGLNHKQIDCNGDGYINVTDIAAISRNYNRTHNRLIPTNRGENTAAIPMYLNHTIDTLYTAAPAGGIIYSDIMIGSPTQSVTLGYGATMRIEYPVGLLDATQPIQVTWDANSWLAANTPIISLVHNDSINGILDIAISRTNQLNAPTGQGRVGRIKWIITDNINGRPAARQIANPFTTTVTEAHLTNKLLIQKTVQGLGSSVVVISSGTTATESTAWQNQIKIFPNPVTADKINIASNGILIENVVLNNVLGQKVLEMRNINANTHTIESNGLPSGTYLLAIQTAKGVMTQKVIVP